MNQFTRSHLIIVLLLLLPARSKEIAICSDANYWYPFSYVNEQGNAEGLHVDMLVYVLNELGYAYTITPLPWKRCFHETKEGKYDAILNASYKPDRAEFMYYPEGAASNESHHYLTKVSYVVITPIELSFDYSGNNRLLPQPIRSILGYSIVDDLTKQGIPIKTGNNVRENFESLLRTKQGSIITTLHTARAIIKEMKIENKLRIHKRPITSKSYFIAFSKSKGQLTEKERLEIWKRCETLRKDTLFMDSLYQYYEKQ